MINTEALKKSVEMLEIISKDTNLVKVASSNGGEFAGPCPFCGGSDRFRVQPLAGRWLCRGCTDGRWHDVIEYVRRREKVGFHEACRLISHINAEPVMNQMIGTKQTEREGPPSDAWQNNAMRQAADCANRLRNGADWIMSKGGCESLNEHCWSDAPPEALAYRWLNLRRGLKPETIRKALLGYNPNWDNGLPPGITIPCFAGRSLPLWYIKVRTFRRQLDKYLFLKGSIAKTLYQADSLLRKDYAVIVEGEFDSLLLEQEAGDLVAVVTMGSAGTIPGKYWRPYFALLHGAFIALDLDRAGQNGLTKWTKLVPWLQPLSLFKYPAVAEDVTSNPDNIKDITDFWSGGGNLRQWIESALMEVLRC